MQTWDLEILVSQVPVTNNRTVNGAHYVSLRLEKFLAWRQNQLALAPAKSNKKIKLLAKILVLVFQEEVLF